MKLADVIGDIGSMGPAAIRMCRADLNDIQDELMDSSKSTAVYAREPDSERTGGHTRMPEGAAMVLLGVPIYVDQIVPAGSPHYVESH